MIEPKILTLDEQWKHTKNQVGEGWHELLDDLRKELDEITEKEKEHYQEYEGYRIFQVKEKFGGLRVHVDNGIEKHLKIIDYFEGLSYHICEQCGHYGKCRNDLNWVRTLCEEHYEAKRKEIKEENLKYLKEKKNEEQEQEEKPKN